MKSFLFKVECGEWSAEIEIPAANSLASLAETILKAVDFENDHAFGFYDNLKNPYRSKEEYSLFADMGEDHHEHDTGVVQTEIDSVFKEKKKMAFLFDYGDDWIFLVTCVEEKISRAFKRPKILSTTGKAPEQYPEFYE